VLPFHDLSTTGDVTELTSRDILEASYNEADEKLLKLEEELDILLYSVPSIPINPREALLISFS
jgi:hypothetical protein